MIDRERYSVQRPLCVDRSFVWYCRFQDKEEIMNRQKDGRKRNEDPNSLGIINVESLHSTSSNKMSKHREESENSHHEESGEKNVRSILFTKSPSLESADVRHKLTLLGYV